MSDLFPEVATTRTGGDAPESSSPLDAAAAKGDMRWPSDPDLDPEGSPEPLRTPKSNVGNTMTGFVGARGFPPN